MVAVEELFGNCLRPDVGMLFAAARAELAFTAERNGFNAAAVWADVFGEAASGGAAVEHLFGLMDDIFGQLVFVKILKQYPVIIFFEDVFKAEFASHDTDYSIRNRLTGTEKS